MKSFLKNMLFKGLTLMQADRLFRFLNREKLLVLMYHGITECNHQPPVWTQLPVDVFRRQMKLIAANYRVLHLHELVDAVAQGGKLPANAALITFDDGLKNNYTVAYPVLSEMGLPATIFLTVDLMGTDAIFWFDELYLILRKAAGRTDLPLPDETTRRLLAEGKVWEAYLGAVESLKRCGASRREAVMASLTSLVEPDPTGHRNDFGMLAWEEIREMHDSGLIEFGAHTATHRILAELEESEWHRELLAPRLKLEKALGREVKAFCFPNGRPGEDFDHYHKNYLRSSGYTCAFSTVNELFDPQRGDSLSIGRVPAGNDDTSHPASFRLGTSGALHAVRNICRRIGTAGS